MTFPVLNNLPAKYRVVAGEPSRYIARARVYVNDEWSLSVIQGMGTYGTDRGLFECAVMHNGNLCYDTPITDDVIGHCSEERVLELIKELEAYVKSIQYKDC